MRGTYVIKNHTNTNCIRKIIITAETVRVIDKPEVMSKQFHACGDSTVKMANRDSLSTIYDNAIYKP